MKEALSVEVIGLRITDFKLVVNDSDVEVRMNVLDRSIGTPITLTFFWPVTTAGSDSLFDDPDAVLKIRKCCIEALTHELDECLSVNGRRRFDPHAGEPR